MNELKTPSAEAEPDRSLTLSIHLGEAFMLRQALMFYRLKFPRNFDCGPPDVRDMVKALDCAMETADPKCMAEIQDTLPKLEPIVYKPLKNTHVKCITTTIIKSRDGPDLLRDNGV